MKTPKRSESEGFKRPARFRGLDRKPTEDKGVASYQPFSASPADEIEDVNKPPSFTPKIKVSFGTNTLYDSDEYLQVVLFFFFFFFRICMITSYRKKRLVKATKPRNTISTKRINRNKATQYSSLVLK